MAKINKFKEVTHPNGMREIVPDGYILITEEELEMEALLNGDNSMTVAQMNAEKQEIRANYRTKKDNLDWNNRRDLMKMFWGFAFFGAIFGVMVFLTGHELAIILVGFTAIVGIASIAIHFFVYIWQVAGLNEDYDARMNEVRAKYF